MPLSWKTLRANLFQPCVQILTRDRQISSLIVLSQKKKNRGWRALNTSGLRAIGQARFCLTGVTSSSPFLFPHIEGDTTSSPPLSLHQVSNETNHPVEQGSARRFGLGSDVFQVTVLVEGPEHSRSILNSHYNFHKECYSHGWTAGLHEKVK